MLLVTPVFVELVAFIPCLIIIVPCEEIKTCHCSTFTQNVRLKPPMTVTLIARMCEQVSASGKLCPGLPLPSPGFKKTPAHTCPTENCNRKILKQVYICPPRQTLKHESKVHMLALEVFKLKIWINV